MKINEANLQLNGRNSFYFGFFVKKKFFYLKKINKIYFNKNKRKKNFLFFNKKKYLS